MNRTLITGIILALFIAGSLTLIQAGPNPEERLNKVVVLPVKSDQQTLDEGAAAIDTILGDYFLEVDSVTILTEERAESLMGERSGTRLQNIQTIANRLDSQAVLLVNLLRYRERRGDRYSVDDAASLAFEYRLFAAEDGRVLCYGRFDETQEPLSDNILGFSKAFKRGFKWVTVEDLGREAIRTKLGECRLLPSPPKP